MRAFIFKNRGLLLALPALALVRWGRPSAGSIAAGLPLAVAGELLRCWAVGYSGVTTRSDAVTAPKLITAGPYAYVRNPLYIGNFITAAGFALAFTGKNSKRARRALLFGSLAAMAALYAAIIPHEEEFLQTQFGEAFERYCERVPRIIPHIEMPEGPSSLDSARDDTLGAGWDPDVLIAAESRTFATFAAMLAALMVRARRC